MSLQTKIQKGTKTNTLLSWSTFGGSASLGWDSPSWPFTSSPRCCWWLEVLDGTRTQASWPASLLRLPPHCYTLITCISLPVKTTQPHPLALNLCGSLKGKRKPFNDQTLLPSHQSVSRVPANHPAFCWAHRGPAVHNFLPSSLLSVADLIHSSFLLMMSRLISRLNLTSQTSKTVELTFYGMAVFVLESTFNCFFTKVVGWS